MEIVSLSSGSSGNSTFISYKDKKILIDCGISLKMLKQRLKDIDEKVEDIDYLFLTHCHDDHIKCLLTLMGSTNIKAYSREQILRETYERFSKELIPLDKNRLYTIPDDATTISIDDDFKLNIYEAHHDVRCVYYKFICGNEVFAILTDNGHYDDNIIDSLKDVNYLMLECNYDYDMLMEYSKYPDFLKTRISGDNGHLSNESCCEVIKTIANDKLKLVCLSHISEHSNTEEYALQYVTDYFSKSKDIKLPKIIVASRYNTTKIL